MSLPRLSRPLRSTFLAAALLSGAGCGSAADAPPDVFLIVVDTLRADRLGCYGYPRPTSPNIDRLAAEGTRFSVNTAQCSWTKPSMVSMFSGHYVTAYQDVFREGQVTLAEAFSAAGYRTIGVVGNVLLSSAAGFDRGFEHYDARELSESARAQRERAGGSRGPCRSTDTLNGALLATLEGEVARRARGERRPLFVYLHPMEPHAPYDRRPGYERLLPRKGARPSLPSPWHLEQLEILRGAALEGDEAAWKTLNRLRTRYDREVRFVDEQLGALLEVLEADGLLENAVVALVADHGEALWDHPELRGPSSKDLPLDKLFQRQHGRNLYRTLVGTPFVLWGAGAPAGTVVQAQVENVDLFPTLLELADLPDPGGLHGASLVPLMRGERVRQRDAHSFVLQHTSLREEATGLKLILPSKLGERQGGVPRLYDLRADPLERVNLCDSRGDDVARLRAKLEAWRAEYPNETTLQRSKDPATLRNMKALGYFGGPDEDDEGGD